MDKLPEVGFLRIHQIIGDPRANPPVAAIIPVGRSTWWAGVKSGRFPAAVKLGPNITAWRVDDIRALIDETSAYTPRTGRHSREQS